MEFRKYLFGFAEKFSSVAISEDVCKKCKICLNSCPSSAITLEPDAFIDQKKCIKCYCCHELCPNGAVELKTSFMGRIILKRMNYKS
ncbi:MAG: 4Fe-4S binding protein [Euryarchaeota archaeon]|nr:4Fe-4S binding protein [Euryarchaeota archaeon]MBU4140198.1 4Fe-4S binding protein [Euryarchaeota archaeon]